MLNLDPSAAAAVIGVAAFEIVKAWKDAAPSVQECRDAPSDSIYHRQQMLDACTTVGGMALVIGGTMSVLMRRWEPLVIMLIVFGSLALLHYSVLEAPSLKGHS